MAQRLPEAAHRARRAEALVVAEAKTQEWKEFGKGFGEELSVGLDEVLESVQAI